MIHVLPLANLRRRQLPRGQPTRRRLKPAQMGQGPQLTANLNRQRPAHNEQPTCLTTNQSPCQQHRGLGVPPRLWRQTAPRRRTQKATRANRATHPRESRFRARNQGNAGRRRDKRYEVLQDHPRSENEDQRVERGISQQQSFLV